MSAELENIMLRLEAIAADVKAIRKELQLTPEERAERRWKKLYDPPAPPGAGTILPDSIKRLDR